MVEVTLIGGMHGTRKVRGLNYVPSKAPKQVRIPVKMPVTWEGNRLSGNLVTEVYELVDQWPPRYRFLRLEKG